MQFSVRFVKPQDWLEISRLAQEFDISSIPPGRTADLETVKKSIQQTYAEVWSKQDERLPPNRVVVLEDIETKEILGYLILLLEQRESTTFEKQAFILDMGVVSKVRGKKGSDLLLQKAEEVAKETGHPYLVGMISVQNQPSIAMAKRYGFILERYQFVKAI